MELEELERKYKELGEEIKRIKSKPEEVWCVCPTDANSNVFYTTNKIDGSCSQKIYTRQSNAFSTKLEAARMAERFNLELEISEFIKDSNGEVDWENEEYKWTIEYLIDNPNKSELTVNTSIYCHDNNFYFNSRSLAEQAIEIYGNRLKFAWGITDER